VEIINGAGTLKLTTENHDGSKRYLRRFLEVVKTEGKKEGNCLRLYWEQNHSRRMFRKDDDKL
jgi:hypothetical protein